MEGKIVKIKVRHVFTKDEYEALREVLYEKSFNQFQIAEQHAIERKRMKEESTRAESERKQVMNTIAMGAEDREVDAVEEKNFATGFMEYYDPNTGELLHTRKMTPSERQMELTPMLGGASVTIHKNAANG